MWKFLGKLLEFLVSGFKLEMQKLADANAGLITQIKSMEEILMTSKDTLQELATQIGTLKDQIADSINNIASDIQGLTDKLANAMTPEEVQGILQPQIDALQALAAAAKTTADIVPDQPPVEPPAEL